MSLPLTVDSKEFLAERLLFTGKSTGVNQIQQEAIISVSLCDRQNEIVAEAVFVMKLTRNSDNCKVFINVCQHEDIAASVYLVSDQSPHDVSDKGGEACVAYTVAVSSQSLCGIDLVARNVVCAIVLFCQHVFSLAVFCVMYHLFLSDVW